MSKPKEDRPYMPWYVKDWLSSDDRSRMTYEARGLYRDMLDRAWLDRGIPSDRKVLAQMFGITLHKLGLLWAMMASCWQLSDDGSVYINGKQERVRADMDAFKARMSVAGKAGNASRWHRKGVAEASQDGRKTVAEPSQEVSQSHRKTVAKVSPSSSSSSSSTEESQNDSSVATRHPIRAFLARHEALFVERYAEKPAKYTGRDAKHASDLLRSHGVERAGALLEQFFRSGDEFIVRSGHTLGAFVAVQNKLIAELSGRAPKGDGRDWARSFVANG
jgi:uncharacterized protein YdaU (DUF1376 family)